MVKGSLGRKIPRMGHIMQIGSAEKILQISDQKLQNRGGLGLGRIPPSQKLIGRDTQGACNFLDGFYAGIDAGVLDIVKRILPGRCRLLRPEPGAKDQPSCAV